MKVVTVSPGKLGLAVEFHSNQDGAVITATHPTCTFRDEVEVGDRLISIDGKPIFSVKDIQVGNDRERQLGILPNSPMDVEEVEPTQQDTQQDNSANLPESSTDDDADAPPKQPIGIRKAYNFFQYEMRVKLAGGALEDEPSMSMTERWRTLTEAQKKPYEKMVACDKVRYHREMAEYLSLMNQRSKCSDGDEMEADDGDECNHSSSSESEKNGSIPDWQSNRKRKRKKSECDKNNQQQEKPYRIDRCMSIQKLDQSATYLEELIRTKTDELQRIKRRREYLKSIEPIPRIECSHEGCTNKAMGGGLCRKHGGTHITRTIQCSVQGCPNQARSIGSGVCYKHGSTPRKRCNLEGCNKFAKAGGYCIGHAVTKPKHYYCKVEGCMKSSQLGGLCARHGAPIRRCFVEGCTSYAKKEGLCARHAVESSPLSEA